MISAVVCIALSHVIVNEFLPVYSVNRHVCFVCWTWFPNTVCASREEITCTYQSETGQKYLMQPCPQSHNHYSMSTVSPVTQHALSPHTQAASPEAQQWWFLLHFKDVLEFLLKVKGQHNCCLQTHNHVNAKPLTNISVTYVTTVPWIGNEMLRWRHRMGTHFGVTNVWSAVPSRQSYWPNSDWHHLTHA